MGKPRNLTIIQIYAPTSDSDEDEINDFYHDLEKLVTDKPKKVFSSSKEIGMQRLVSWNEKTGKAPLEITA